VFVETPPLKKNLSNTPKTRCTSQSWMVDLAILRTKVMFIVKMMIFFQTISTLKSGQSIIIKEGEG
jgi:hypothetical protein